MRGLRGWGVLAGALAGLLLIAGSSIIFERHSGEANPSATSFEASGTLAFRQLLDQQGYRTAVTSSLLPRLQTSDLLVVFDFAQTEDEQLTHALSGDSDKPRNAIQDHLNAGGRVMLIPVARDFARDSRSAGSGSSYVGPGGNGSPRIQISSGLGTDPDQTVENYIGYSTTGSTIWQSAGGYSYVSAYKVGPGRLVVVKDGLFATNRFIDRFENARFAVGLIRGLAKPGTRVVFDEAYFGEPVEPGLLETIGPWAEAMWFQAIFLFIVIVYTLGKRFGLPELAQARQRGTRELLDAVAGTLRRGRMTSVTLSLAASDAEGRLRRSLQLPMDMPQMEFLDRLPSTLQRALVDARNASVMRTRPDEARRLAARLEDETSSFLGPRRRTR